VDGSLNLYDSASLQKLWTTQIFTGSIWAAEGLSFSADNTLLAAGVENTVTVWNTDSGQKLFELVQADNVLEAALSPDGRRLAAGLGNGDVVIWDLATQRSLQTLNSTLGCIFSIDFSPDGTHLAVAGTPGELPYCNGSGLVSIWDLAGDMERIPAPLKLRLM
jgi:WD40 repeat protein